MSFLWPFNILIAFFSRQVVKIIYRFGYYTYVRSRKFSGRFLLNKCPVCGPLLDHASAPGGPAVPDNQGKLPICTRCALAKAIVDGLYKGIYLPGESIDVGMLLRFEKRMVKLLIKIFY